MGAAHKALPDALVREIRMPEGGGNAQFRMWREGDFRSLGNNVVFVSSTDARVVAVDRFAERASGNRVVQALAGLHYDEWGGMPFRLISAFAGLATPLLFVSGILIWWYSRRRKKPAAPRQTVSEAEVATAL